jgi:hypothetical protein
MVGTDDPLISHQSKAAFRKQLQPLGEYFGSLTQIEVNFILYPLNVDKIDCRSGAARRRLFRWGLESIARVIRSPLD